MSEPGAVGLHEAVREALVPLHSSRFWQLEAVHQRELLNLRQVSVELDRNETTPEDQRRDQAVRSVLEAHLAPGGPFEPAEARFLALWFDTGTARTRDLRPATSWRTAVVEASNAAFRTAASDYRAVRIAVRRRSGPAWQAIERLVGVLLAAEQGRVSRPWIHGAALEPRGNTRLAIVTAHHGIGLGAIMAKYAAAATDTTVIDLDVDLVDAGLRCLGSFLPAYEMPTAGRELSVIYAQSRRTLHWIWREAFEQAWTKVLDSLRTGRTVLLGFSATVYHERSGAISTAVNDAALIECLRAAQLEEREVRAAVQDAVVVTLIDDVFDCFARLRHLGEPFDPSGAWPPYPTRSAVLRTILEWRQREVMDAERTAQLAGWSHVILPTKHPLTTLRKIVDGAPIVYVSHPVRAFRPTEPAGTQAAAVADTAAGEVGGTADERARIIELCDAIAGADVALIEGLAIDELRFRETQSGSQRSLQVSDAHLLPRWRSAGDLLASADALLWAPPPAEHGALVEQPLVDLDGLGDAPSSGSFWSEESPDTLLMLRVELERQGLWRTRLMVNQATGGLFMYRPFGTSDARLREGARTEATLRHQLLVHERQPGRLRRTAHAATRPIVLYHPPGDERRRAVASLAHRLAHRMIDRVGVDLAQAEIEPVIAGWVHERKEAGGRVSPPDVDRFLEIVIERLGGRHHLDADEPDTRSARELRAANEAALAHELEEVLGAWARDAFVYGSNYLEDAVVLDCGDDEPVAELAAQVLERLAGA